MQEFGRIVWRKKRRANINKRGRKMSELTLGEQRVRKTFNPDLNIHVAYIKDQTAKLIDYCEGLKDRDPRLASLAQTAFEEGAMWAVKAATAEVK